MEKKEIVNKKGKKKRIKISRQKPNEQNPEVRNKNFEEVSFGFFKRKSGSLLPDYDKVLKEASRCLGCKKATCVQGCPVGVNIPAFIKHLKGEVKIEKALEEINKAHPFPQICGRVCPQEIQCEKYCSLGKKGDPIAIGQLERFVGDYAYRYQLTSQKLIIVPNGKKVAIVGSGPAGLAAAYDLVLLGYEVVVFEALHKPGGVLPYGIPEFRLPKEIVDYEINNLKNLGVKFVLDCPVGKQIKLAELREIFDAVFLGLGAGTPIFPNIPGRDLNGVMSANEYLTRLNLMKAYLFPEAKTPIPGAQNGVVIGGGNVAMDAVRWMLRLGAKNVTIAYRRTNEELPARREEIHHAQEEGVKFEYLVNPVAFLDDKKGNIHKIRFQKMQKGEVGADGRAKVHPISDFFFEVDCDLVIIAIGSLANRILLDEEPDIETNKRGYIKVTDEEKCRTSIPRVYTGGDITTGSATVIQALGAGKTAARAIHEDLNKKEENNRVG